MINVKLVRIWMVANDVRPKDLQEILGYAQCTPVSLTINGKKSYRRVVNELIRRGCPAHYFDGKAEQ